MKNESEKQDVWVSPHGMVFVSETLIEKIKEFPVSKVLTHCDVEFAASPFDNYANCPECGTKIKLRGFSGDSELEDLFDAFFVWLMKPGSLEQLERRREQINEDYDDE